MKGELGGERKVPQQQREGHNPKDIQLLGALFLNIYPSVCLSAGEWGEGGNLTKYQLKDRGSVLPLLFTYYQAP